MTQFPKSYDGLKTELILQTFHLAGYEIQINKILQDISNNPEKFKYKALIKNSLIYLNAEYLMLKTRSYKDIHEILSSDEDQIALWTYSLARIDNFKMRFKLFELFKDSIKK